MIWIINILKTYKTKAFSQSILLISNKYVYHFAKTITHTPKVTIYYIIWEISNIKWRNVLTRFLIPTPEHLWALRSRFPRPWLLRLPMICKRWSHIESEIQLANTRIEEGDWKRLKCLSGRTITLPTFGPAGREFKFQNRRKYLYVLIL